MYKMSVVLTLCLLFAAPVYAGSKTYRVYDDSGKIVGKIVDHGRTSTVWGKDGTYMGRASENRLGDVNLYDGSGKYFGKVRPDRHSGYDEEDGEEE